MPIDDHVKEKRISRRDVIGAWVVAGGLILGSGIGFTIYDHFKKQEKPAIERTYEPKKTYQ